VKWRPIVIAGVVCAVLAGLVIQLEHARQVGHWLQLHTGIINEPGPYYGFWSGFGSDIEEFGILGAIGAAVYQLVKKYNCHEPGCWRIGNHPAAGGQFMLCYRHHPDFRGQRPNHELIERLHRQHQEQQEAIHVKLQEIHDRLAASREEAPGEDIPGQPAAGVTTPPRREGQAMP
jgi:hypothetical protein